MHAAGACGDGKKMQIVISEKRPGATGVAETLYVTEGGKRFRAAVDEVAYKKQLGVFRDDFQKIRETFKAPLQVAYGINGRSHGSDGCVC